MKKVYIAACIMLCLAMPSCLEKAVLNCLLYCDTQPSWCLQVSTNKVVITKKDSDHHHTYYGWSGNQLCISTQQYQYQYSNTWTAYDRYLDYGRSDIQDRVNDKGYAVVQLTGNQWYLTGE